MNRLSLLVAILAMLAGCAGEAPAPAATTEASIAAPDHGVSDTKGAIEGIVIDEGLEPVAGAEVILARPNAPTTNLGTNTTGVDGKFLFPFLDPGAYLLTAQASGRSARTAVTEVIVLEVAQVRIALTDEATREAYVELQAQTGILYCVASALVWPGEPYADAACGTSVYILSYAIPDGWAAIVGETAWNSAGDSMLTWYIQQNATSGAASATLAGLAEGIGESPVRVTLIPGEIRPEASRQAPTGSVWVTVPEGPFSLETRNYYTGRAQRDLNQTFSAQCYAAFGFTCFGVGASPEFRYDQYMTIFINGRPESLDAYTALPDA